MKLIWFVLLSAAFCNAAVEPLSPKVIAQCLKLDGGAVTQMIHTVEYNSRMKSRGLIEGEIIWAAQYKEVGDRHVATTLILVKKGTQKKMLGLYSTFDYAETLRSAKEKELPGMTYKDLGNGAALLAYSGGVGPGKQALTTMIPVTDDFDLIIGASDQSRWASQEKDFEKRFIELAEEIYKKYKK